MNSIGSGVIKTAITLLNFSRNTKTFHPQRDLQLQLNKLSPFKQPYISAKLSRAVLSLSINRTSPGFPFPLFLVSLAIFHHPTPVVSGHFC